MPRAPVLHVHRGNRVEVLAEELAELLREPPGGPLVPEWIVVQGRGMGVWLSMQLARHHGVWTNCRRLHPRELVETAFTAVLGAEGSVSEAFSKDRLLWSVLVVLPELLPRPELGALLRYLANDDRGERRVQLAWQITLAFDHYLTYRPEMLCAWERGEDGGLEDATQAWQPPVWRALVDRLGTRHVGRVEERFLAAVASAPLVGLPERLTLFGLSSLPPAYARVVVALARRLSVHLFLAAPSAAGPAQKNPLVGSLGRLGAEFEQVLAGERAAQKVGERATASFSAPDERTLLGRLQADVFHGRTGTETSIVLTAGDESLSVHACHGPMREVEVLHDRLLDLLAGPSAVEPHEVVVLMSDVDAYAPYVEAVFGRAADDPGHIPYRIADRPIKSDAPVIDAFSRLLGLCGARVTASEVLDLLNLDAVRRRFELSTRDVERIAGWVVQSNVRWGVDAAHRGAHGQPELHQNSWRFGLERLLLGWAMPTHERETFAGVLPFDEIEGQDAELVGKLAELCERLFFVLEELSRPRPLAEWRAVIVRVLALLLVHDRSTAWQHQRVTEALAALADDARSAGFAEPLDVSVLGPLLQRRIDDAHPERGFLAGGVTFCAFVPMRSIPFRAVCMLGMSDGAFPRAARPAELDVTTRGRARRRPGDRSQRDDDRTLFLEALMSARERLIVTYVGQSIRDNAALPPSVVLSELLDRLPDDIQKQLVVRHPLQAFSPRYFDGVDARLYGYDAQALGAARSLSGERGHARRLFDGPIAPGEADADATERAVSADELVAFFENPITWLLRRRLHIELREQFEDVPDREPLELDPLESHGLGAPLFELALDGENDERLRALARASGRLPPGALGEQALRTVLASVRAVAAAVRQARDAGGGLFLHRYARISGKHLLGAWVRHLFQCKAEPGLGRTTRLVVRVAKGPGAEIWTFREVADAAEQIAALVGLFRAGTREPLPLLPRTSLAFAQSMASRSDRELALAEATKVWSKEPGERTYDANAAHVLRGAEPPFAGFTCGGLDFVDVALAVFGPLLEHAERR